MTYSAPPQKDKISKAKPVETEKAPEKVCPDLVEDLDDEKIKELLDELGLTPSMYDDLTPSAVSELATMIPDPVPNKHQNDDPLYDFD